MSFNLYALLSNEAPKITIESLAKDLQDYFKDEKGLSIQLEQLPFSSDKSLTLRWDTWRIRLTYEVGEDVAEDSAEISKIVCNESGSNIVGIDKRIRLVFGNDENQEYTNQIIFMLDFIREIPGVIVFDPQQRDLVT